MIVRDDDLVTVDLERIDLVIITVEGVGFEILLVADRVDELIVGISVEGEGADDRARRRHLLDVTRIVFNRDFQRHGLLLT